MIQLNNGTTGAIFSSLVSKTGKEGFTMQTLNSKIRVQELLDAGEIIQQEADVLFDSYSTVDAMNKLIDYLKAARRSA